MNKKITTTIQFVLSIILICLFFTTGVVLADSEGEIIPDQIVVLYDSSDHDFNQMNVDQSLIRDVESVSDTVDLLHLNDAGDAQTVIGALRESPGVRAVDYESEAVAEEVPNDKFYSKYQGYLKNINYENMTVGPNSVKVAVLDTGVNADHEDLVGRVDQSGYNYVGNNKDTSDLQGHGTAVAGVIAAQTDNKIGIAGVAGRADVKVVPYTVLDSKGEGKVSDIAAALQTLELRDDVKVINLSFGFESHSDVVSTITSELRAQGKIIAASSGNTEQNGVLYPARLDDVFAVGAVNINNKRCDTADWGGNNGSTYGEGLDIMAPGDKIAVLSGTSEYELNSGTSFSAPVFSGACAVAVSHYPYINSDDVMQAIQVSSKDLYTPGWDIYSGYGLLQMDSFINALPSEPDPEPAAKTTIYRLYNPITGEHLYTPSQDEVRTLTQSYGWRSENIGWYSPTTGTPVYRLFNPAISDHLYTSDKNEVDTLVNHRGWVADFNGQPVLYAADRGKPVYRLYNSAIKRHLLTIDSNENTVLSGRGWDKEGIGFYALSQ